MKEFLIITLLCLSFSGCTFSIILTDTHGSAEDVVDSTPTQETDIQAEVPLKTNII